VTISFRYTGNGLSTSKNQQLIGFSVDGQHLVPAEIKGDKVIIEVEREPEFIYYGWKPFSEANLVNSENLPASTFKISVE
ncbi:MAG TPA: sialate O-acetylesterase, partial [Salinimicrobium sp.]|nr:sialate O-acetylesterase [Salinimicrobium sp.]